MIQPLLHTKSAGQAPGIFHESILRTLAYYDIFHYPLTAGEIRQYADTVMTEAESLQDLQRIVEAGLIFYHHGFYSLQDNPLLAHRRKRGNQNAEQLLVKAQKIGRFLYHFPFVKAIGISGSLSKNYADDKADIDFFIITKAERLWIARSLMHLYKKFTFIFGKQHHYCMNYYIDEKAMALTDQNIFTAIEIKTLLPVTGEKTMQDFFRQNPWSDQFLPSCSFREQQQREPKGMWFKKIVECLLGNSFGEWLDNKLFRWTQNRWNRKVQKGKKNEKGQPMELNTSRHFARSNPGAFQEKVLAMYKKRVEGSGGY